jgi:PST family polysaccharide transporter
VAGAHGERPGAALDIDEVQRRARSGPRALVARRAFAVCVGVISTVTIPHLVPPREYGLAAMAIVVFGLADMFRDLGLTSALLRKGEVRSEEVTFLFWFNCAMTFTLAGLLAGASPLTAMYFHEPLVAPVMLLSIFGFVADGLALQHRSVMGRDLRFQALATIDSCVTFLQFAATLCVAVVTHDVWAIVAGFVVSKVLGAGLTVAVSKWWPGPPRRLPDARHLFVFGANVSAYNLSVFVALNIAAVVIGRFFGPSHLGQYNRALALQILSLNNIVAPLAEATLPVLARLRPHPELYRKAYLDLVRNLNIMVLPAAVLVFFAARPLVTLVLGPKWAEAGQLLQALAPVVAAPGFGYAANDLFITQDRSAELRTLGFVEAAFRVAGVLAALPFGVVAVVACYSATTVIVVLVRIAVAGRTGPVTLRDHVVAIIPAIPLAIGALIGCAVGMLLATQLALPLLPAAAAICVGGGVAGCLLGLTSRSSRDGLIELAATLRGRPA